MTAGAGTARLGRPAWLFSLGVALLGCKEPPPLDLPPQPKASASAADRLAPGELQVGLVDAFGLKLPAGMRVERRYRDAVHATGKIRPEDVSNYLRQRVAVTHVEVGAARTVFPKVRIKGGDAKRTYRLEVVARRGTTLLVVQDITPPPTPKGLSDAERWKRAGMTPDGKPLDMKKLE